MRKYRAFGSLDPCRQKDTDINLLPLDCGFPKGREGEVPPTLVLPPTQQSTLVTSSGILKVMEIEPVTLSNGISRYHSD